MSSALKRGGTIYSVTSTVQKAASLMIWGCINVYDTGSLHIWKSTVIAEHYVQALEKHLVSS